MAPYVRFARETQVTINRLRQSQNLIRSAASRSSGVNKRRFRGYPRESVRVGGRGKTDLKTKFSTLVENESKSEFRRPCRCTLSTARRVRIIK